MIAVFQYKLYPTKEQEATLLHTLETLRHLYNNALGERIDAFKYEQRSLNYCDQANELPMLKKRAPLLTNVYSYVENLNIAGMLKNHHLARAISDVGWGQFFRVLSQKAASAAKRVVEVCPRNTSQNCSGCGEYVPKALSVRTHDCPYCGLLLHRDKNAAENIRQVGRDAAVSR